MGETIRNQWTVDTLGFALDGKSYQMLRQMLNTFKQFLPNSLKETALLTFLNEYLLDFVNIDPNDERVSERHVMLNI